MTSTSSASSAAADPGVPFGPARVIHTFEASERFDSINGALAYGRDGILHGALSLELGDGSDPLMFDVSAGTDMATGANPSARRGHVLALDVSNSGDGALLYSNQNGTFVGLLFDDPANDTHLSSKVGLTGSVLAYDTSWWAVWSESNNHQRTLFQASSMVDPELQDAGGFLGRQQVGSAAFDDAFLGDPVLAFDPWSREPTDPVDIRTEGREAVLAWGFTSTMAGNVLLARARRADAFWFERSWLPADADTQDAAFFEPALAADYYLHGAYRSGDSQIVYAGAPPSTARELKFPTQGSGPRISASSGFATLAWTSSERSHIIAAIVSGISGSDTTDHDLTPNGAQQHLVGVASRQGLGAVVAVDHHTRKLWIRTQNPS